MVKKTAKQGHTAVAVGVGIAAAAAAAAGAYFLYGTKEGAKRRRQIKGWMLRMKGEVMERMENMQEVSEAAYHQIVDAVARSYKGTKNVNPAEVMVLANELKTHWKSIKKHLGAGAKKTSPRKKAAKKTASK